MSEGAGAARKKVARWLVPIGWIATALVPLPFGKIAALGVAVLGLLVGASGVIAAGAFHLAKTRSGPAIDVTGGPAYAFAGVLVAAALTVALGATGYGANLLGWRGLDEVFVACALLIGGLGTLGVAATIVGSGLQRRRPLVGYLLGGGAIAAGGLVFIGGGVLVLIRLASS